MPGGCTGVVDRMGKGAGWARSCCYHALQYLLGGQLLDPTPVVQEVMLFLEPFVKAEGTGFFGCFSNRSIGVIVTSGLVVDADLLDTNIDGNETVLELQGVAVEVLLHKNPDRYKINEREIRCLNWIYLQDKLVE